MTTDHLGSTRLLTDQNGNVVARHDFLPFGEELTTSNRTSSLGYGASDNVMHKYTGKERDQEGPVLDFFHARYFHSAQGRFSSPDPMNLGASPDVPQTWDAYSYVNNDPLSWLDPTGLEQRPAAAVIVDGIVVDHMTRLGGNALSICPNNVCSYQTPTGLYQFGSYACGLSGYVPFGLQPYAIQTTAFGNTYTTFGGIILAVGAPQDPSGSPLPPPVALPPGKNGEPNGWVSVPGTVTRPMKWKPRFSVPSPRGCQPGASWDPDGGHWDVTWGNKTKDRFLPDGTKVDY